MDLTRKCVVVTGGSNGIGLSFVRELLRQGVAKCANLDLDVTLGEQRCKELCEEYGKGRVIFVKCDVTKLTEFESAMDVVLTEFKYEYIDILINNAGILNDRGWEKEIAVNVNGVVNGMMCAFRCMGKDKGGKGGLIVNTASILGLGVVASCPIYCATKHAVIGLSRSWAMPFNINRSGVHVMVMCPGVTNTELIHNASDRLLDSEMGQECLRELSDVHTMQSVENVTSGLIHILKNGTNGSIWVCEKDEPVYEVCIPDWTEMRKE